MGVSFSREPNSTPSKIGPRKDTQMSSRVQRKDLPSPLPTSARDEMVKQFRKDNPDTTAWVQRCNDAIASQIHEGLVAYDSSAKVIALTKKGFDKLSQMYN